MSRTRLLEAVPEEVREKIDGSVPAGEDVLIRVFADIGPDGRYTTQWVVVTDKRVLVVPGAGADGVVDVPVEDLAAVRAEALVGGGCLEIDRKSGATVLVPYSSSLGPKFSEVARGLEQLRKEETFLINPQLDRMRCEKCGRLLPEKNGICPACVRRWHTLGRITSFMWPHKLRVTVLAIGSVATTLAELAPPLVMKRMVDDVLVPAEDNTATVDERLVLLGWLVLALVGVRVWSWTAELVHGWVVTWLGARVTADIRSQLYRRLEMLSLQFYDKRQVGSLV